MYRSFIRKLAFQAGCLACPIVMIMVVALTSACSSKVWKGQRLIMGTDFGWTVYPNTSETRKAVREAFRIADGLDAKYTTYNEQSFLSRLNATGRVDADVELVERLRLAQAYSELTGGLFDVSVYPLVKVWREARENNQLPTKERIMQAQALVDYRNIHISEAEIRLSHGAQIDSGANIKGYAVDEVYRFMETNHAIQAALVIAGGNLRVLRQKPDGSAWRIGVKSPRRRADTGSPLAEAITLLPSEAMATSGDYERFFIHDGKRYHHILDPSTGYPATNGFISVTVLAENAELADLRSTSLFLLGPAKALELATRSNWAIVGFSLPPDKLQDPNVDFREATRLASPGWEERQQAQGAPKPLATP